MNQNNGVQWYDERGEDLINFAVANGFMIINTFFCKSDNKSWTRRSPNNEIRKWNVKVYEDRISAFQIELKNRYEIHENLDDQNSNEYILKNLNNNVVIPLKKVARKLKDRNNPQQ